MDSETRQLLAWYVNGTLAGKDRDRVESALQNEAESSLPLAWERAVQAAVKDDRAFEVPADRGLSQTMQRIRAEAKPKGPSPAVRGGWFSRLGANGQWSPALALACGVVVFQFAVIAQIWTTRSEDGGFAGVRTMDARPRTADAFIQIAFKPESTEGDLNALLREIHAEIVSGPTQLGDYYLLLERQDAQGAQDALNVLQNSANVESAEIVNALPARP